MTAHVKSSDQVGITVADLELVTAFFVGLGGYGLVGGIGEFEDAWRMAYVRGPDGVIVGVALRIDA